VAKGWLDDLFRDGQQQPQDEATDGGLNMIDDWRNAMQVSGFNGDRCLKNWIDLHRLNEFP
jgi:hypothetical protein